MTDESQKIESLIRALNDPDEKTCEAAAEALAQIGEAAVEPLLQALGDAEANVRLTATMVLKEIGAPAVESLLRALGDAHWQIRWNAAEMLGWIRDARAVEPLIGALGDPTLPKTLNLTYIFLPVSFARLHSDLKEGRFGKSFSDVAAEALRRIGTPEALAAVEAWEREQHRDEG